MYRSNYQSWGYSPLDQVNTGNVKRLVPAWSLSTGVVEGHQSPPIVNDGVMFITTPQAQVFAVDAKSGDVLWHYRRELPEDLTQLHPTNRGVALWGDKVFVATVDCFLVALDAKTGEVVWEQAVDDYANGYYMTLAPLVAQGRVMVGVSGGEYGIRGYVAAYDANGAPEEAPAGVQQVADQPAGSDDSGVGAAAGTVRGGRELWRTYTVPGPGEPGNESWPGDTWKRGGASIWITGCHERGRSARLVAIAGW